MFKRRKSLKKIESTIEQVKDASLSVVESIKPVIMDIGMNVVEPIVKEPILDLGEGTNGSSLPPPLLKIPIIDVAMNIIEPILSIDYTKNIKFEINEGGGEEEPLVPPKKSSTIPKNFVIYKHMKDTYITPYHNKMNERRKMEAKIQQDIHLNHLLIDKIIKLQKEIKDLENDYNEYVSYCKIVFLSKNEEFDELPLYTLEDHIKNSV